MFEQTWAKKVKVFRFVTPGILEKQIPNLELDFQNSEPKIHFWLNAGQKNWNCSLCLKIGKHGILEEPISNPELDFQNSDLKIYF